MIRRFAARWARRLAIGLGIFALLCAVPVAYVETSCKAPPGSTRPSEISAFAIPDDGYRRAEGDSYLTYPEWYIVHAYTDLAGMTRQASESAFDYLAGIFGFWTSLCHATIAAGRIGEATVDQKTTNYIIGLSFTAEMALIGLYERTIGAATAWARGAQRTAEDEFALAVADDYAAFLQQTPWYRYPFWSQMQRFWLETPWGRGNLLRGVERRFALSLEFGAKGLYAVAIGYLAGYSHADISIKTVVAHMSPADIASDTRIKLIRQIGGDATLIETPRYQEYTDILRLLGARGLEVLEIAGNRRILATVLAPVDTRLSTPGASTLFVIQIQSRPGWQRLGLDVEVTSLTHLIGEVEKQGAEFEHAYDY